jgi:hypothetical protein
MQKALKPAVILASLCVLGGAAWLFFGGGQKTTELPLSEQEQIAGKLNAAFRANEASVRRQLEENPASAFLYESEEATVQPLAITYTYKLKEGVSEKSLEMDAGSGEIKKAVCKTPQMEPLRKAGTVFRYVYLDRSGRVFYEFSVRSKEDCR